MVVNETIMYLYCIASYCLEPKLLTYVEVHISNSFLKLSNVNERGAGVGQ